jgi:hypothetical protein
MAEQLSQIARKPGKRGGVMHEIVREKDHVELPLSLNNREQAGFGQGQHLAKESEKPVKSDRVNLIADMILSHPVEEDTPHRLTNPPLPHWNIEDLNPS